MATRNLSIRFSTKEQDTVIKALRNMGDEGEKLGKKLEGGGRQASKGLKAVDNVSNDLQNSLRGVANRAGPAGTALESFGTAGLVAAAGIGAVVGGATLAVREFAQAELSTARLNAILNATENAAGKSADELIRYAEGIEAATLFTAEQVQDASAQMLTFKAITGDTFNQAMGLAIDLSATFGTDLKSSVLQLGKALEDPVTGISALREVGVSFTAEQKLMIKELIETNELVEAQGIILEVLEGQVGGTAKAIGSTLTGSWDNLTDAIGNFAEAIGGAINDSVPLQEFIKDTTDLINRLSAAINGIQDPNKRLEAIQAERAEVENSYLLPGPAIVDALLGFSDDRLRELAKEEAEALAEIAQEAEAYAQTQTQVAAATAASASATKDNKVALDAILGSIEKETELLSLSKTERQIERELRKEIAAAQKDGINLSQEERALIREKIATKIELQRIDKETSRAAKEQKDLLGDYINSLGVELELTELSNREREIQEAVIKATTIAKREDKELTEDQIALIREREGAIYDAAEAEKIFAVELERSAEIYEEFARDLGGSVRDGIKGFLDGSIDDLNSFAKTFEDIFFDLIANIGMTALANPLIVPIVTTVGGAFGLSGGQLDSIAQEFGASGAGGGIGLSDISSLSSLTSVFDGLGSPIFSGGSTIASGINSVGELFGFAGSDAAGPFLPGSGTLASQFTTGSTLAGVAGGFAADLLGLSGEYSSITGTAGSLIGTAIGGPIGAALGSFLGSAVGGLFGGKPSDNTSTGVFDLGTGVVDQSVADRFSSPETQEFRDATIGFTQSITQVLREAGANFDGLTFTTEIGTRDGLKFDIGTEGIGGSNDITRIFGSDDVGGFLSGVATELTAVAGTSTAALENIKIALENINFEDQAQALQDLAFAADYDKLLDVAEAVDPVIAGFESIATTAERAGERAERLGLSLNNLTEAEIRAEAQYLGTFNEGIFGEILSIVDPDVLARRDRDRQIADLLNQSTAIGGNTDAVRLLQDLLSESESSNLELASIRALQEEEVESVQSSVSRLASNATAFDSFLFDTSLGDISGLDPQSRLDALKSEIQRIDALAADDEEKQTLAKLLPEFTELSAEINGFNTVFADDLEFSRNIAERNKTLAETQLEVQQDILVELQNQSTLLVAANDNSDEQIQDAITLIESVLSADQLRATQIGRAIGALDSDEFAINGVLGSRLDLDPDLKAAFNELWHSPAFSNGGIVTGGIPGRDSVVIRAMPGERVLSVPHSEMLETIYGMAVQRTQTNETVVHLSPQSIDLLAEQVASIIANSNHRMANAQQSTARAIDRLAAPQRFNQL